ncbi:MAG TPA: CPBP family intramembrane glutamic endopeptidase [Bryobacteraceae bacterium]|nr:CPBP family intramembrane glutamic endopeptidase [Bryobacteraceae bacterium]
MRSRLDGKDLRFLSLCFLVLLATVWFSARFFYRAFPEASIDFRVTREEAGRLAGAFLRSRGLNPAGYREAARFRYDDDAKTFLERELGLERANRIMGARVRLWQWSRRWFRPLEKEEFRVDVTPRGETVGFAHLIPEAAARPSVSPEQARALAEGFLREVMHRDPAGLDFVEGSSVSRPARTDHIFAWKEHDFDVKGATYRVEVTVLGSEIGGYREYLKIPETWQRDYERLRSRNLAAQTMDTALMMLLGVGLLVMLLRNVRRRDVPWRQAGVVGVTGAVLIFLSNWNSRPLAEFAYPTTDSYGSFVARQLLQSLLSALAGGGLLFLLTAGAEPLYRRAYPKPVALGNLFRLRGLRTKRFFKGAILGLTLTGVFVAYQTAFYLLAYRWGAWSPADVPYDDLLNTRLPWLFVLLGGFLPAVSEEFMFRMFSIPFLRKLLRSAPAAVVLAGFIWGFGHAGYPQQPFYIRGVEVGIGGVALGWIMLRWGILPTLVWHYSVDAMYSALLLMRSHNLYFVLSGAASAGIMVLPVLAAWIAYLRGRGFEPEEGLTNADACGPEPAAEEKAEEAPAGAAFARPWTQRRRITVLALAAAGLASLAVPVERFGDQPRFAVTAAQAQAAGDRFLAGQGLAGQGFQAVTYVISTWDADTGKYFLARRPVSYLAGAYQRDVPLYGWVVRYYKPLDQEELRVALRPDTGQVFGFDHTLPEDRPGADVSAEEARRIAAAYLAGAGFDLSRLELKEASSEKKKARRDHALVWEAKPGDARNLEEARYRVSVEVAGDRVAALRTFWKLPEAFVRERSRRNALSNLLAVLRVAVLVGGAIAAIWLLIQRTRRRQLRWRPALWIAAALAGLSLADSLARFHLVFRVYDTAVPPGTFTASVATSMLISAISLFLGLAGAAGLLSALRPEALAALSRAGRRQLGADAVCAAALALGLAAALSQAHWLLADRFPGAALLFVNAPTFFAVPLPALSAVSAASMQTLVALAALALAAYLAEKYPRLLVPAGLAGAAALVSQQAHSAPEFALQYFPLLLGLAVVLAFCRWAARRNYLAYGLAAWSLALGQAAFSLLQQSALRLQGWILIAVLAASALSVLAPGREGRAPHVNP